MTEDPARANSSGWLVVINDEEQYSIWPSDREIPPGWDPVGEPRTRLDALRYIDAVWTDMRPKSLRVKMDPDSL